MPDLGTLRVLSVIVHEIPARMVGQAGEAPTLSEIESPTTLELRHYFRERIIASLASAAFDVIPDPETSSPVPQLVNANLAGQRDVVDVSREMAQHLFGSQTGVNSPGLLVVAGSSLEDGPSLGVLKLEKEEGVRVQQAEHEGKVTFSLEHVRELMLTERTRVFKAGLFVQQGTTLDSIEGWVSDKQRGYRPTTEVADFFLRKFLGFQLREAPEVTTKRFFQSTQRFINDEVPDPVVRARYEIALLAELNSASDTLHPQSFAQEHLQTNDRQRYVDYLGEMGIAPQQFVKRIDLIESQLRRIQMNFESGIAVFGPPSTFDDHVRMTNLEDGRTRVQIEDRVRNVEGK